MPGLYPTVRRRRLAAELKRLRVEAGLTGEQVAERLAPLGRWSASKISRIETGQVAVHHGDVGDLLDLYGVADGPRRAELVRIARESGKRGWWQSYRDVLPEHITVILDLEAGASSIRYMHNQLVPGLLQTADYARALIQSCNPGTGHAQAGRLVDLRMARQRIFERENHPSIEVLFDEAALRRPVGGNEVMRGQLQRLIEHVDAGNALIRVLPFAAGEHIAMDAPFVILSFPGEESADVVYLEQHTTAFYMEEEIDVSRYNLYFDRIRALALDPGRSRTLILETAKELK